MRLVRWIEMSIFILLLQAKREIHAKQALRDYKTVFFEIVHRLRDKSDRRKGGMRRVGISD